MYSWKFAGVGLRQIGSLDQDLEKAKSELIDGVGTFVGCIGPTCVTLSAASRADWTRVNFNII